MTPTRPDFTTKTFWLNTVERTVRVFAWSSIAAITTVQASIVHADFQAMAVDVGIATALAFLGCLAGKLVGDHDSPSFLLPAPRHRSVDPDSIGRLRRVARDTDTGTSGRATIDPDGDPR